MPSESIDGFLSKFDSITKKPTKFLSVQDDITDDVKQLIKSLYDFTKTEEQDKNTTIEALPELIIENFDEEQIWQEIELQNNAKWEKFVQNVASCVSNKNKLNFPVQQKGTIDENITTDDETQGEEQVISSKEECVDQFKKKSKKIKINKSRKREHGKTSIVDDDFFKLNEMEKFLDHEDKKEMIDNKQNKKESDSDEDSIDLFEPSDDEDLDEDNEKDYDIKYKDFFDSHDDQNENVENEDDSILNEEGVSDNENDFNNIQIPKKNVRFNLNESESDDDKQISKSNSNNTSETQLSEYELRQKRLREKIRKLEEKNLAEKPWQLKGEVNASIRPQNSLLEEVLDFDLTTRPAPIITEETTLKLEDIIKQRIKDKVWDDVERKAKPIPDTQEFKKAVILDQEKSKMSLAQVYEQEYLKQKRAITGDNEAEEEEPEQHKSIRKAMKSLFAKLDALTNYHYTPKPAQPEVKIVSNIPAISLEEVAPVATSDAALLAPEEVKAKRKSELMSKNERTDTDKKRERRKKKALQRQREKEKAKKENLINKLNPGLGNKYSKEKASKLLDKVTKDFKNTEKMTQLNDGKSLKSSRAFFTQLNEDVSSTAKTKKKKSKELLPAKKYKL